MATKKKIIKKAPKKVAKTQSKRLTKAEISDVRGQIIVYKAVADFTEERPREALKILTDARKLKEYKESLERVPSTAKGVINFFRSEAAMLQVYIDMTS